MNLQLTAPNLWASAHAMLKQLFFRISGTTPAHLQSLKPRERKQLRDWLAALEAMVRKILLIEAANFMDRRRPAGIVRPHGKKPAGTPAVHNKRAPTFALIPAIARPPQHPARIRMLGAPTSITEILRDRARANRIAALRAAPAATPQSRLANRISAIARVIANPHAAIRALARRLRASKQIGYEIIAARAPIPPDFHGDARVAGMRAFELFSQPNSS